MWLLYIVGVTLGIVRGDYWFDSTLWIVVIATFPKYSSVSICRRIGMGKKLSVRLLNSLP